MAVEGLWQTLTAYCVGSKALSNPFKPFEIRSLTELWTLASVSYFLQQVAVSPPPMMEVVPALSTTLCECLAYEKGTGKRPAVKFQSGQH